MSDNVTAGSEVSAAEPFENIYGLPPAPEPKRKDLNHQSSYTPERATAILEMVAAGGTRKQICLLPGMPTFATLYRWQMQIPEFHAAMQVAERIGTHFLADECIEIADGPDDPNDKRIRIDTRLRIIGKRNAREWGEKVQNEISGPGGGPIQMVHSAMTAQQASEAYADTLKALDGPSNG